jgi:hypothetical protein
VILTEESNFIVEIIALIIVGIGLGTAWQGGGAYLAVQVSTDPKGKRKLKKIKHSHL